MHNWNEIFSYSNGKIYWKIRPANRVQIGDEAGGLDGKGYLFFEYKGKTHLVHVVIWEMHHGVIPPGMQVDHVKHNRTDNRVEMLRLVNNQGNSRNRSKNRNNSSGVTGVVLNKATNKWMVRITVDGTQHYLGSYSDFTEAVHIRRNAEVQHGFHENHGK